MMAESKCYLNTTGQSGFKKFRAVTNAINDTETFRQVSSSEDAPFFLLPERVCETQFAFGKLECNRSQAGYMILLLQRKFDSS